MKFRKVRPPYRAHTTASSLNNESTAPAWAPGQRPSAAVIREKSGTCNGWLHEADHLTIPAGTAEAHLSQPLSPKPAVTRPSLATPDQPILLP